MPDIFIWNPTSYPLGHMLPWRDTNDADAMEIDSPGAKQVQSKWIPSHQLSIFGIPWKIRIEL